MDVNAGPRPKLTYSICIYGHIFLARFYCLKLRWRHEASPIVYSPLLVTGSLSHAAPLLHFIPSHCTTELCKQAGLGWLYQEPSDAVRVALCRRNPSPPQPPAHSPPGLQITDSQPTDLQQAPRGQAAADHTPKFLVVRDFASSFTFLLGVPPTHTGLL